MKTKRYLGMGTAPEGFGLHPALVHTRRRAYRRAIRTGESFLQLYQETTVPLERFLDPRHPSVYVIPRDRLLRVVDSFGDAIGMMEINLPFSSTNFHPDVEDGWVFEAMQTEPFYLLGEKPQLGYLVPPWPEIRPELKVTFCPPLYVHSRWIHSLIAAMLTEVILARNGFSREERAAIVLAVSHHDAALPIGGDSVKRIDRQNLDEEKNFTWSIEHFGLAEKWRRDFGLNIAEAAAWVQNEGIFGQLLDYVDKISYVALDCYNIGIGFDGQVRAFCRQHPLFMDVWQDLRFTPDKSKLGFCDRHRLFDFLMARALEHRELLLNPYGRTLDFYLTGIVRPLYESGLVTKENLLTWTMGEFENALSQHYPPEIFRPTTLTPESFRWQKFATGDEAERFKQTIAPETLYHEEEITGFNVGLDWPIFAQNGVDTMPAGKRFTTAQINELTAIVDSTKGHFLYWHTRTP